MPEKSRLQVKHTHTNIQPVSTWSIDAVISPGKTRDFTRDS